MMTDAEIVERVRAGETALFEILMRRHNQRIYRVARAVIKDEADTEDVMQQAYINAFTHLSQFQDRSQFSTWLTRITVHEALARRRKRKPEETPEDVMETLTSPQPDPERQAYAAELRRVLEAAVDSLPETYRLVFMLRDIEGLSTSETAAGLELGDEAVKTRLHRARAMVRSAITERIGASTAEAFAFQAPRCDRVVAAVMAEIVQRVHVTS
ncbi:MAG: RNA polymerase sigma factor [Acidobacteria bacterium]|nr:MAG: RNA polymerase sigma factor [Acidobacteriota bacterium]PYQ84507.1 MAG: RNA polymerase sigma factor [Acidobacteriota bacterium]PYQ89974.1 MAG: RNA polymerase sigma factor [Acidobacteriota bacterium]PYR08915.1 MAG: RNA polymerase sigma factor [Acidobacteriota bacterium]